MTEDKAKKKDAQQRKAVSNRIAKVIGHTKAIKNMVEDNRDCSEVLIQLAAVRAAINNTGKVILKEYLEDMIGEAVATGDEKRIQELNEIIDVFLK